MMFHRCLLVFAACILGNQAVPVVDDPVAYKNATWLKCQKQENVPDDAMKDLYFFESVERIKDHKCVTKCINEEYGIYQKNGTISQDMIAQVIKELWKEPQVQEKLIKASAVCVESVNPSSDPCQHNYDLFDCYIQVSKKEGITINH